MGVLEGLCGGYFVLKEKIEFLLVVMMNCELMVVVDVVNVFLVLYLKCFFLDLMDKM